MKRDKIQNDILNSIKGSGRLILAPRIGKTKIIISLIKREKYKSILWITPSRKLIEEDLPIEFKKWRALRYLKRTQFNTWKSLNKITGYYDLIVLDEEQFITENNSKTLLNKTLRYNTLISMTGTKSKDITKNFIYKKLNLDIIEKIEIKEASEMGILSDYQIINILIEMKDNIQFKNGKIYSEKNWYKIISKRLEKAITSGNKKDIKLSSISRMRFIANSNSKNKVAKELIEKLRGKKIIIFANNIKQAEELCENSFHSKTTREKLILFSEDKLKCISMVNSGGVGFTYKNIDYLIIIQVNSNTNGLISQKIARTLLKQKNYKAKIIILTLLETQDMKWTKKVLKEFSNVKRIVYDKQESIEEI